MAVINNKDNIHSNYKLLIHKYIVCPIKLASLETDSSGMQPSH
jgi:hypothetical protein